MFSAYTLLGMRASLFSLDIRNYVCILSLGIDLPDHIPKFDREVLICLAWGRGTFRNVLLIRMKDVEYGWGKFRLNHRVTKIPKLKFEPRDVHNQGRRGWAPDIKMRRVNRIHASLGSFSSVVIPFDERKETRISYT